MITVFGIKSCNTMKKAFDWLDQHAPAYVFHDYKKSGIDPSTLAAWAKRVGWATLLNTQGTTWRSLPDAARAGVNEAHALALMAAKPSLIKRPVIDTGEVLLVGFDDTLFRQHLMKD